MEKLNKKGLVTAELVALIVIPGSLTLLLLYFILNKTGINKKLKKFKLQKQN